MESDLAQQYVFILGREREIALVELEAVLRRFDFGFNVTSVSGNIAVLNIDKPREKVAELIAVLGGTTKIFRVSEAKTDNRPYGQQTTENNGHSSLKAGELESRAILAGSQIKSGMTQEIVDLIIGTKSNQTGKLDFGISSYRKSLPTNRVNQIGLGIKKELKKAGISTRFVALREGTELSTIQTLKNKLVSDGVEIGVFDQGLGILIALNNPEEWNKRDYDKPAGDKYSGMVPPKLARALVNLALTAQNSEPQNSRSDKQLLQHKKVLASDAKLVDLPGCVVYDPFCGSGNILMEAMMLGCDVVGSDISEKAVNDTRKNLEWLIETQNDSIDPRSFSEQKVFQADVTDATFGATLKSKIQDLDSSIVVVTEPYLGEPKKFMPSLYAARGEYAKVKDIYLRFLQNLALSNFHTEVICLIFPLVETSDKKRYSLYNESVDEIGKLGYTEVREPLIYGRDYQVVKREIVFLRLQSSSNKIQVSLATR